MGRCNVTKRGRNPGSQEERVEGPAAAAARDRARREGARAAGQGEVPGVSLQLQPKTSQSG